ncbi:MAG: DegT/DnrJ/EryC1/StrS family aminotransferase [Piscinibacter sp.]|nr:DegT/DnrJ/EryC1/StrS family aminotransferase [Piscinibacter sp.]
MSELRPGPHPVVPSRLLWRPHARPTAQQLLALPGLELTFNARGALMRAFGEIAALTGRKQVLLPAYHCPSVVGPVLHAGLEPVFYRIRRDLSIDVDDLLAKAGPRTAAVLVIHFFGVPPDLAPLSPLRQAGVLLVEDCSHSFMLADPLALAGDAGSDYRAFSFWKIVPSGVGGGLWRARPGASSATPPGNAPWVARARSFKRLMEESIEHGGAGPVRSALHMFEAGRARLRGPVSAGAGDPAGDLLRNGEVYYPLDPEVSCAAMPGYCRRIIEASDLDAISARRRANFARFAAQVEQLRPMEPLITELPTRSCPWVYPVLLEGRSAIDFRLRAAGVQLHTFGIYLHSALFQATDEATVTDAVFLAERVLCLAIHQDLDVGDIDRSVSAIRHAFSSGAGR